MPAKNLPKKCYDSQGGQGGEYSGVQCVCVGGGGSFLKLYIHGIFGDIS